MLSTAARVVVAADSKHGFETACASVVGRLGIRKLVWVDPEGGLVRANGGRDSFIDAVELVERIQQSPVDPARAGLFGVIRAMLDSGVDAVNLCRIDGMDIPRRLL